MLSPPAGLFRIDNHPEALNRARTLSVRYAYLDVEPLQVHSTSHRSSLVLLIYRGGKELQQNRSNRGMSKASFCLCLRVCVLQKRTHTLALRSAATKSSQMPARADLPDRCCVIVRR